MKGWFAANPTVRLDTANPPCGRVLCFHGAGCDASLFVTRGSPRRPLPNPLIDFCVENNIELLSFQMPGRGGRSSEKPFSSVLEAAETVLSGLEPFLARSTPSQSIIGPVPLFVVGHSLGALLAYEFACLMRRRQLPPPKLLVLASMVSPELPPNRRPWRPSAALNDAEFREEMRAWGAADEVFAPAAWAVFGPILRRDMQLADQYSFAEPPVVPGAAGRASSSPLTAAAAAAAAGGPNSGSPTTASGSTCSASSGAESPNKRQSFHAPLGVDTTVFVGREDRRVTRELAAGWERVIMGANLFTSSPSGLGTAAKNGSVFELRELPDAAHNFLYEPKPRATFLQYLCDKLDQMLIDLEYGASS